MHRMRALIGCFLALVLVHQAQAHWYITNSTAGNRLGGSASSGNTIPCSGATTPAEGGNGYFSVTPGGSYTFTLNIVVAHSGGPATADISGAYVASNATVASTDAGNNVTFTITIPNSFTGASTVQFLFATDSSYYQCLDIQAPDTTTGGGGATTGPSTTSSATSLVASAIVLLFVALMM